MKKYSFLLLLALALNIYAQENVRRQKFSEFIFGALAGVNFTTLAGGTVIIEGKTNVADNIYMKLSLVYNKINNKEGYNVKTNTYVVFDGYHQYVTQSYNVDQIKYDVGSLSIGFEYFLSRGIYSPYLHLEYGYNSYSYHTVVSKYYSGFAGVYDTFDELPPEYKNKLSFVSDEASYKIGFGAGFNYPVTRSINLDVRYIYQINRVIPNINQILLGINF